MKAVSIGKIQSRTLADMSGNFANDLKGTLMLLGKQFYPDPSPMLHMHEKVEEEVGKWLDNWEDIEIPKITTCEYRKTLSDMSVATAPGFDQITNNVIHMLSVDAKYERWYIRMYNMCLRNKFFPAEWKKSRIILIPKVTTLLDTVKAFRPISLTSAFAKLLERIVLGRMNYHLEFGGHMVKNQHAYRKGTSTQTALLEMFEIVQYAMNRKEVCVIVFLDISGAFDRTWHYGILYRLLCYGVPVYLVAWIKEFLKERTAFFIEGDNQHEVLLEQGCPQGGVLSPVLWNVLFNDFLAIQTEVNETKRNILKVIGYADDAAVVCKAATVEEASVLLNKHLEKVSVWSEQNRVQFNTAKLAVMTISNRESRPSPATVFFNGTLINEVETYKYLGLVVDNKLTWRRNILNVLDKLAITNRTFRGIAKQNWGVKLEIFKRIYHSIFYPIMTYGIAIWGWRATHMVTCKKFDRVIRIFGLMATRCLRSTLN